MLSAVAIAVLDRLLEATRDGRLAWRSDEELDFVAPLAPEGAEVVIQRLWLEVVGQAGADPYLIKLSMPGWNTCFPISAESDGCRRLCAILEAGGHPIYYGEKAHQALELLDRHLPTRLTTPDA